jgi:hypothetical protein
MKRILPVILLVTALGLGAFGFSEHQNAGALTAEVASLKDQVAKLQAQVKQLTDDLAAAKRKNDALTAESKALRDRLRNAASATADATQDDQNNQRRNGRGGGRGPQGMMRRAFGEVIAKMNLSEEQQNQLFDLLSARGQSAGDTIRQAIQNGQTDPASLIAAIKAKNAESDQQISALLGSNYAEFKKTQDSMGDSFVMGQFQNQLTQNGAPLQDYQSTALSQVMAEERLKMPSSVMGTLGYFDPRVASQLPKADVQSYIDSQKDYNKQVLQRVGSVLNADQQKALSDSLNRMVQFQERALQWGQRRGPGGPGGPGGGGDQQQGGGAAPAQPVQ